MDDGRRNGSGPGGLAVGVVSYNSLPALRAYFAAQVAVARELGIPLVVVDNASSDGSSEYIRHIAQDVPVVRLIRNRRNVGYAAAVNQIFAATGGADVLLLNADVELRGTATVIHLVDVLGAHPRVGVVAPRLLNPDGSIQSSARPFPTVLAMAGHASAARILPQARRAASRYLQLPPVDRPSNVDWAIGAALLIRRAAFDAVGGFDERFFLYLEDADFCLRLGQHGWATRYEPAAVLTHLHVRASDPAKGGVLRSRERRLHVLSLIRFFARYPRLAVDQRGRSGAPSFTDAPRDSDSALEPCG